MLFSSCSVGYRATAPKPLFGQFLEVEFYELCWLVAPAGHITDGILRALITENGAMVTGRDGDIEAAHLQPGPAAPG